MFQSVILAGGFGTRLKSLSGKKPKPMMDIGGIPFLYILMKKLEKHGCSKIVLSLFYEAEYIIKQIEKDKPVNCCVEYCVETVPMGTGGAIKLSAKHITHDKFFVLNGDTYCDIDYKVLLDRDTVADLLVVANEVQNVQRFGKLEIDKQNNILRMNEKNSSGPGYINSGVYLLNKTSITSYPLNIFSFENDFIKTFDGIFKAHKTQTDFVDIGIPSDYHYACQILT